VQRCTLRPAAAQRILLAIALLLFSVHAHAQTPVQGRGALLTGAYLGFAMGQALDVQSTSLALSRGARETNALMRPCVGSPACSSAVKAATTAGIFWIVDTRIRPRSRTAAVVTMVALTTLQSVIVARNYRVAHELRER
jgi:hypothetical protein